MQVTKAWLQANRTARGGWTKAQADILGLEFPLKKGWHQRIIGKELSSIDAARFELAKSNTKYSELKKVMNAFSRLPEPEKEQFRLWLR